MSTTTKAPSAPKAPRKKAGKVNTSAKAKKPTTGHPEATAPLNPSVVTPEYIATKETIDDVMQNSVIIELTTERYGIKTTASMENVVFASETINLTPDDLPEDEAELDALLGAAQPATVEQTITAEKVDKKLFTMRKKLFDSPEWKAIKNFDQQTYRYVQTYALKSDLRSACYRLPVVSYTHIEEFLAQRMEQRKPLVEEFVEAYENHKRRAKWALVGQYRERDYHTPAQVRGSFAFSYRIINESVPEQLLKLNSVAYEREQLKAREQIAKEVQAMAVEMRNGFASLVNHFVEKLQPDEDGVPKKLREATVENLKEFVALFDGKNLAGDKQLAPLVAKTKELVTGITAKGLKESPEACASILEGFEAIKEATNGMIIKSAGRRVRQLED